MYGRPCELYWIVQDWAYNRYSSLHRSLMPSKIIIHVYYYILYYYISTLYNFFRSVFKTVTFKFAFHGIFYWILVNLIKRPSVNGQNFYPKLLWFISTCALAKKACPLAFFVWFSIYSLFVKGNIITIIHLCSTNFNGQFRKLKIQTQVCTQRCLHVYIIIITAVCVLFLIKLRWPNFLWDPTIQLMETWI